MVKVLLLYIFLRYVHSCFAIILMGRERELVALLSLFSWCLVIVVWLFISVPWFSLQFVTVISPDHTHYFWVSLMQTAMALASLHICLVLTFVTVQNSHVVAQMAIECHCVRAVKALASLHICIGLP